MLRATAQVTIQATHANTVKKLYANSNGKNKPFGGPYFDLFCRRSCHLSAIAPHLCTNALADAKAPFFNA